MDEGHQTWRCQAGGVGGSPAGGLGVAARGGLRSGPRLNSPVHAGTAHCYGRAPERPRPLLIPHFDLTGHQVCDYISSRQSEGGIKLRAVMRFARLVTSAVQVTGT